jgi:myosin heavy subunit
MHSLQGTRLRKIRFPQQPQAQPPQAETERHSRLLTRRDRQSASVQSVQSNQEQETDLLRAILEQAASSESFHTREIEALEASVAQTTANETSLKRKYDKMRTRLAEAASTESSLRREIERLKESLARSKSNEASLKQESENQRSLLVQAASTELSLRQEIKDLKRSRAKNASKKAKLREEIEVTKTTLMHSLVSEVDMRISARETREEWEKVEKSLREEIDALGPGLEVINRGLKGKMVASHVQQANQRRVRTIKDTIALEQPSKALEGSSDIHILLDDLALQSLAKDGSKSTPHLASDAFGTRVLPEFAALERATEGLQLAINSELRAAYAKKWSSSSLGSPQCRNASVARNMRLLVVLWDTSGVEELMSSLTSIFGDATLTTDDEDCAICTEQLSPEHKIVVEGCGHAMCKGCLREYIGARLGEKVWPVRCPICMAEGGPGGRARGMLLLTFALEITA